MNIFQFTRPKKSEKRTLKKTYGYFQTGYPANCCYKIKELQNKYYKNFHGEDNIEHDEKYVDCDDDKKDDYVNDND